LGAVYPSFSIAAVAWGVKPMRLAVLAMVLILADHFFFEGRYREAAWLELRGLGDRINAELVRWSPGLLGRK
jgi:hypothetical protein